MKKSIRHQPVMVNEVLFYLIGNDPGVYVDATVGLGGHTGAILGSLTSESRVLGIDLDGDALEFAREKLREYGERVTLVEGNFVDIPEILSRFGIEKVDGILFDLGLSSFQLASGRGFSYRSSSRLDMRFGGGARYSAYDVVNRFGERELSDIFYRFGEERFSRRIAKEIVTRREKAPIETSDELAKVVVSCVPGRVAVKSLSRVFQALRIFVNNELENLSVALSVLPDLLNPNGRICVISYHSLEDRIVKNRFKELISSGMFLALTKKPVSPGIFEVQANRRSRSAKLRCILRKE
ncbi:16S rRNA (cytosine(1402)-N(4))-methyltransferase RsmH [bacterium]|nr:16S rRNA (cytosine(1402)-N(4))-methyltransferase RsmH [bacterium]